MIRRLFFAAIAAGLLAGVIISAIHQVTTVPLILQAETYENSTETSASGQALLFSAALRLSKPDAAPRPLWRVGGQSGPQHDDAWAPADGVERIFYTSLTTILAGIGFALLLIVGMVLRGEPVDARRGVLWGAGGFVAFTLAPALGLAPEIPGAAAADLMARQIWWIAAAVAAIAGLWLLIFTEGTIWKAVGVIVIAGPHVFGAPHPHGFPGGGAPAELAAQFAATSIAISALFWVLLGGFAGHFFGRSAPEQ
ncbi:MAG: CbtA family protein [Proteobacteria bacterium]|nr:CbtA family protein [Pseudomonadota bacterium]